MYNKTVPILADDNTCCGCFACVNACPVDAINMCLNNEYFIMPKINIEKCISCNKCSKVCPVINFSQVNDQHPDCYAIQANDSIRSVSSSGGLFSLIANEVIDNDGYVCGASFNSEFGVEHIIINSKKDLNLLQGSKYVQSDINYIFREIKKLLADGKKVFFTGTPCQVAGLNNFLGKNCSNLLTADILCHGVPSQYLFKKHVYSLNPKKEISRISFRDKSFGWTCLKFLIEYTDGSKYIGDNHSDAYERAFHSNLSLRHSCSDCKFSTFPRCGDVTIGDFWGYERFSPQHKDSKGTSIAFINSEKGHSIFRKIKEKAYFYEQINYTPNQINNRIFSKYPAHKARQRFFDMLPKHGLEEASTMAMKELYDVCLVGIPTIPNFGGALTYYALYNTLEDLGYSTLMIERPWNVRDKPKRDYSYTYETQPYPSYAVAPIFPDKVSMRQLNKKSDVFMVGSDQLFNRNLYKEMGEWITLDWVSDSKIKIAYAASFGHGYLLGEDETRAEMSFFMKKFDHFSVREIDSVKLCDEQFGVDATHVLDPVFLCKKEHYIRLSGNEKRSKYVKYISSYILDMTKDKENIINYTSNKLSLPFEVYSEMYLDEKKYDGHKNSINSRLNSIIYSDFVVTDSFHGTCFAIIFHKNFITIRNKKRGAARFESILGKLNLLDRMVDSIDDIKNNKNIFNDIDWKSVDRLLEKEKLFSLSWLDNAVRDRHKKSFSDYDILIKKMSFIEERINNLSYKHSLLQKMNSSLIHLAGFGDIMNISDIYNYLNELHNYNDYIFISVKDTPGFELTKDINKLLSNLGITIDLTDKHWHSFIAIVHNKNVLFEKISKNFEDLFFSENYDGHQIDIVSASFKGKNVSSIKIDGNDYSVNDRGLNIVVWNSKNNIVIDSVCFDTHVKTLSCKRM